MRQYYHSYVQVYEYFNNALNTTATFIAVRYDMYYIVVDMRYLNTPTSLDKPLTAQRFHTLKQRDRSDGAKLQYYRTVRLRQAKSRRTPLHLQHVLIILLVLLLVLLL